MRARRLDRVNELIRTELGSLILREMRDPRLSQVVSITAVDVSSDLGYAKVFVSVLGSGEEKQETLKSLQRASGFLRRKLSHGVILKNTPQLKFLLDESIEEGARVLDLIRDVASRPYPDGDR